MSLHYFGGSFCGLGNSILHVPCKELVSVLVLHVQVRRSAGDVLPVMGSIRVLGCPGGTRGPPKQFPWVAQDSCRVCGHGHELDSLRVMKKKMVS